MKRGANNTKLNLLNKPFVFLREKSRVGLFITITAIFLDILYLNVSSDLVTFTLLFFFIGLALLGKSKSRTVYILCLILLVVMFLSYLLSGASIRTEKAAVWFILLLGFGVIKQWRE